MDSKDLWVELKPDQPSYLVLKGTYGQKVNEAFCMSRQGVRWRFQRVFSEMYVFSFETILFIEKSFGTELREHAIRISKERYALRQHAMVAYGDSRITQTPKDDPAVESGYTPAGDREDNARQSMMREG